jgi:hypothetical protein
MIKHLGKGKGISIFCAWGDGPDVGLNIYDEDGKYECGFDFTIDEAKLFKQQLVNAIYHAEQLENSANKYFDEIKD